MRYADGWSLINAPLRVGRSDIANFFCSMMKTKEDFADPFEQNMLHRCAHYGRVEMAEAFMSKHGLDSQKADDNGWLPLHYTIAEDHITAFRQFAALSNLATVLSRGWTLLHMAAQYDSVAIIDYLLNDLSFQAAIPARLDNGETALHVAVRNRRHRIVSMLLSRFHPNDAVATEQEKDRDVICRKYPLHLTLYGLDNMEEDAAIQTIEVLLDDPRTDPNVVDQDGKTLFELAVGHPRIQRLLWAHKHFTENDSIRAVWLCNQIRSRASLSLIKEITENIEHTPIPFISDTGATLLQEAISKQSWDVVEYFLQKHKVNPLLKLQDNLSSLVIAFTSDAPINILDLLVEVAPELLTEKDHLGWTPLHRAVFYQRTRAIEWLSTRSAGELDLWFVEDSVGRTPSDLASTKVREKFKLGQRNEYEPEPKSWDAVANWQSLTEDLLILLQKDYEDALYPLELDANIAYTRLSFYPDDQVRLIRIKSAKFPPDLTMYFLCYNEKLYRLNGTRPPIDAVNKEVSINLNKDNVLDYLRFFCYFVQGDEGSFLIAESTADPNVPDSIHSKEKQTLDQTLRTAYCCGRNQDDDGFLAVAPVFYSNAVFFSDFNLLENGGVAMLNDSWVETNLQIKPAIRFV